MTAHVMLLRGINVGGRNLIGMAELRSFLEGLGLDGVSTYIQSGNVVFRSGRPPAKIALETEHALSKAFRPDCDTLRVLVLSRDEFEKVFTGKPPGFGDEPELFHDDVVFLMGLDAGEAMAAFTPNEGVDALWPGDGVIYHRRLSALRTKSRMNRMMAHPFYAAMTIRSWRTVEKLRELLSDDVRMRGK